MRYPKEHKEAVLRKMMAPHNRSLVELAKESGISEATLYNWRREARGKGLLLPDGNAGPEGWSAREKFSAVVESAGLNEAQFSEYCRKKGLYPEQLEQEKSRVASSLLIINNKRSGIHCVPSSYKVPTIHSSGQRDRCC